MTFQCPFGGSEIEQGLVDGIAGKIQYLIDSPRTGGQYRIIHDYEGAIEEEIPTLLKGIESLGAKGKARLITLEPFPTIRFV